MTGRTLSHYQILEPLGSGGMGEVFKARDTRLNRPVAIKILRSEHLSQATRKQRFIQEAQAASALNHPNIVTIYDIDQGEGVDFMVMEFIAGRTLDARIPRQGMRLNEALRVAVQIAEGLRRAHAAGIVHRDLKPSNIMVGDEGHVKILDFGIAKLTERAEIREGEATRTAVPETEEGTILGTTAYMSPEQAEGRRLDARTDIFSFGVVLYEMLTGRKAFDGATRIATMSAILKEEPKPADNIPAELDRVLRRCLRKDRDKRFQHMDDVKIAIEEIREESESGKFDAVSATGAAPAPKKRWPAIAAAAGLIAVAAGGYIATRSTPKPATSAGSVLRQLTFDPGLTTEPTFWAAGNMIAYASDRGGKNLDIWVQHLETKESRRLTTHEADDREPSFSSDGSRIAFRSERDGGGIYVMSTLGGGERRMADGGRSPKFSPDGQWIAYHTGFYSFNNPFAVDAALYVVPAAGGTPRRFAPDFLGVSEPVWSPDSKSVLTFGLTKSSSSRPDWWVIPVDGGAPVKTEAVPLLTKQKIVPQSPSVWAGDEIVFPADLGDARNLWRVRLDLKTFHVSEDAQRLTSGGAREGHASLSARRLVFSSLQENADIWSLPIEPNSGRVTGEIRRITDDVAPNYSGSVSADGRFVVVQTHLGDTPQIVLMDLITKQERVLATSKSIAPAPRINADGSLVAFTDREGKNSVGRLMPASGGPSRILCETCQLRNWSPSDSKQLIITVTGSTRDSSRTGLMNVDSGSRNLFLPGQHSAPRTSPDGRWIAFYRSIENDHTRIYLAPVRDSLVPEAEWIQVSDGRHWEVVPEFSPDGKTLYFLSHRDGFRCHWAMRIDPATGRRIGEPFAVHHYHSARLSPAYVRLGRVANAVARDKIVFTMAERTGNIWMAELP